MVGYKDSSIYKSLTEKGLSSISASDVYTAIQNIQNLRNDDQIEYLKFLLLLLKALAIDNTGAQLNLDNMKSALSMVQYTNLTSMRPTFTGRPVSASEAEKWVSKIVPVPATLVGGSLANVSIDAGIASYFNCARLIAFVSDTPATYSLTHQDEDDNVALGGIEGRIDLTIATAYVPVEVPRGMDFNFQTDNKDSEVDISGGAGGEKVMLVYEIWQET